MRRIYGVVTGIVKSLDDRKGRGRLQLEFPWLSGEQRSAWASVAVPLSGKDRGMYFMPEENDEVLVAFDQGHFEHPYVVGFLWNGVDKPPESSNKNRVIKTPGGHTLRFEDADGGKKVVLRSSGGLEVMLDDAGGKKVTVTTPQNGPSITLDVGGNSIELQGGGRKVSLQGGQVKIQ